MSLLQVWYTNRVETGQTYSAYSRHNPQQLHGVICTNHRFRLQQQSESSCQLPLTIH